MSKKKEIIEELAQTVFLVFGGLCLAQTVFLVFGVLCVFFSGYVLTNNTGLSFILIILGMFALFIKVEYAKEEGITE